MLMDRYVHEQNIHDCKPDCHCPAEERENFQRIGRRVLVKDEAHVCQFTCKQTYICFSTFFNRLRVHIDMPDKEDRLARLRAEITSIEEEEGDTIL